jgi:hypothetical protein
MKSPLPSKSEVHVNILEKERIPFIFDEKERKYEEIKGKSHFCS